MYYVKYASSVDTLSVIPFFNQEEITAFKRELPSYLAKIEAIDNDDSSDVDCLCIAIYYQKKCAL